MGVRSTEFHDRPDVGLFPDYGRTYLVRARIHGRGRAFQLRLLSLMNDLQTNLAPRQRRWAVNSRLGQAPMEDCRRRQGNGLNGRRRNLASVVRTSRLAWWFFFL